MPKSCFDGYLTDECMSAFIKEIQEYMLKATSMTDDEAHDYAFKVWLTKDWLTCFLNRN